FLALVLREKAGFQFLFFVKRQVFSYCSLRFLVLVLREKAGD
ncbi:2819_t:CDS:2, partial [Rhizophagus irregularis]